MGAKKLAKSLESEKVLKGVYKVALSTAISYAITTALEDIERRRKVKTVNKKTIEKL